MAVDEVGEAANVSVLVHREIPLFLFELEADRPSFVLLHHSVNKYTKFG